jgi:hypothetical protein
MTNKYAGCLLTAGHSDEGVHYQIREYSVDSPRVESIFIVFGRFENAPLHIVEEYIDIFERFASGVSRVDMYTKGWASVVIVDKAELARDIAEGLTPQLVADEWHGEFARILVEHAGETE